MTSIRPSRRHILVLTGSGVGLAALAACGSSGSTATSSTGTSSPAPATSSEPASTSPAPSSSTPSSAPSSTAGSAAAGTTLVALSKVPVGGGVAVTGKDGAKLIVTQPTSGQVKALSAKCTHQGCIVAPKGGALDCPCHGSVFSLTGAVQNGPATQALPSVTVSVVGGNVVQT